MAWSRILVVGSGGAGKSTLATRIAARTGLPLVHLDALYWQPGWVEPPKEDWKATVAALVAQERWVMDGNYGGTMAERVAAADTVVVLDLPRVVCLWRVVRRRVRMAGRQRPDMARGCPEHLSWAFARWIWTYPATRLPAILRRLAELRSDQRGIVLRSAADVEAFVASLPEVQKP